MNGRIMKEKTSRVQKFALGILSCFCPEHLYEEIEGDLIQKFERDVKAFGDEKAKRRFVWNTFLFLRPGIILRNKFSLELNQMDMLINHLRFAIRIFLKDKFFSSLNILGLALGIAISIILLLILQSDLTYDQHYANHERIYRLGAHYQIPGTDVNKGTSARELGPLLKDQFPEIEAMVRIQTMDHTLVKYSKSGKELAFYEENVMQADSSYFQVFSHEFLAGDVATCLDDPHNVVITASMAKRYFNDDDPINKTLNIMDQLWEVSGVIRDSPENTHLKFDILLSGLPTHRDWTIKEGKPISLAFWNPDIYTYMLLPDQYDPQDFYTKFVPIYDRYFKQIQDEIVGNYTPILQRLKDIHFSNFQDDGPHGNLTYLYAFSGIGLMIIVLACINYMNLSTAKAVSRATEIAIKKIVGSRRRTLVLTILGESIFLSFVSLILAAVLVVLVLNTSSFNQLIGKNLTLDLLNNPLLMWGSLGITLCIGVISGLYPAFYLPGIPAITAMKELFKNRKSSHDFRKVLITTQFAVSIFVVVCTLFMRNQIDFVINKDLGFGKDNVLVIPINDDQVHKRIQSIKNELMQNQNIIGITASQDLPGPGIGGNVMYGKSETGMQKQGGILGNFVGDDYLKTLGITLVSGRDFKPGDGVDEDGIYIANEAVVKLMGWGNDALGKKVTFWEGMNPGKVVGVVKDFNTSSLHQSVNPMFIVKGHWSTGYFQIRLRAGHIPQTLEYVKNKWSGIDPNHPFEYFFLDQRFNEQYKEDEVQNKLLSILSYICVFISLLGLIGLSAFTATQRTKEIGVRKVLGANIPDIIFLLSKEALSLIVISSILVIPFSYWIIKLWLQNFAYQMPLNYLLYGVVTIVALMLVFLTVLFQSLKTARCNPADSLKYE